MTALRALMWGSFGLIAWTHVGYPVAAAAAARLRRYAPRRDERFLPRLAFIVAAHDEEAVLHERLENALRLDASRPCPLLLTTESSLFDNALSQVN